VKLRPVVVAQPPHEVAHRGGEAMLVHKADDVAVRRVGLPVRRRRTIHAGYMPSPTGANSRPFTSSFSANGVTVDRDHGRGSSTRIS
jgi:hypothetical protein